RNALQTVANLDQGKLVQAGKVEEIKQAAQKAAQEQLAAANKTHATEVQKLQQQIADLTGTLHSELIGGSFTRSKFISEKAAIPADLVQAAFGKNFKIEDGKVVGYDSAGNKIFSRSRPGEVADFEEALELIVDQYPNKDQILKGEVKGGSGAGGSGNPNNSKQAGKWDGTVAERAAAVAARFPELSST